MIVRKCLPDTMYNIIQKMWLLS